jgi:hypothetical protein
MAGQRLTDKSALNNHTGTGDLYMIVDVSDTTGSTAGTSKKLDSKYVIQTDKISVSNAELQDLASNEKTLVSAPGSGYGIVPLQLTILATHNSPNESASAYLFVGYSDADDNYYWAKKYRMMFGLTTNVSFVLGSNYDSGNRGVHSVSIDDLPLVAWSDVDYAGGWTADFYITYQIIKLG